MRKFEVTGMSCAACQARVEKAVSAVDGVESCAVSLLTNSMGVEGTASDKDIIEAVEKAGYGASLFGNDVNSDIDALEDLLEDKETPRLRRRLISSIVVLLILMYFSMGHMMWGWPILFPILENHINLALLEMVLALIVMIINKKFFISGFRSLFSGAPNMDTLVALGSAASFGYSLAELVIMFRASSKGDMDTVMKYAMNLYFESAAMIPTLITVGKLLEARSKGRTTDALKSLLSLAPKKATVLRRIEVDEEETRKENKTSNKLEEVTVDIDEVKVGDIYILRAGDIVPVDGEIVEGSSAINEAALTGESVPVDKQEGDTVSAGTINTNGFLKCRALRVGEDTTLSQIIQMVGDAAATKAPLARIADKVSAIFVPTVIVLAIITFVGWMIAGETISFAIARAISVLVISCPCALGLATPVAIMVGNGMGAKHGILYKTAEALEGAGRVGVVVLDKTGTITKGEPEVTDILPFDGVKEYELLKTAYGLEKYSEHPLARAVVTYIDKLCKPEHISLDIEDFEVVAGSGVTARDLNGKKLYAGNSKYIENILSVNIISDLEGKDPKLEEQQKLHKQIDELASQGKTPLIFVCENKVLGIIAVADQIKEDSVEAISELAGMGIKTVMLTGDNQATADAIAEKIKVNSVIAGVMPSGKSDVINSLKDIMLTKMERNDSSKSGKRKKNSVKVAMVGDGINDAVALTSADTGLAIGAGTDVAVDAADVVLMKSSIRDVAAAIRMSRATIRNIHENLFWAFFYNALCIPLAMGLYGIAMKPMYGAAAMALSSFFVCMNALRLNTVKLRSTKRDRVPAKLGSKEFSRNFDSVINEIKESIKTEEGDDIMKKTIVIEGMMCEHCEATVQKALEAIEGVKSAKASHKKGTAVVKLEAEVDEGVLTKAVEDKDYKVIEIK